MYGLAIGKPVLLVWGRSCKKVSKRTNILFYWTKVCFRCTICIKVYFYMSYDNLHILLGIGIRRRHKGAKNVYASLPVFVPLKSFTCTCNSDATTEGVYGNRNSQTN